MLLRRTDHYSASSNYAIGVRWRKGSITEAAKVLHISQMAALHALADEKVVPN